VDEKPDFGSTTAVLARRAPGFAWLPVALRQRLTPAALGSAIAALAVAITYVVNAQHDISRLKDSMAESKKSVADLEQRLDVLNKIDTQLAVMAGKVDSIADEVDRQREWRERIEGIAETPPHARRRK
jgi:methionine synthase II (cobalamin-independent)